MPTTAVAFFLSSALLARLVTPGSAQAWYDAPARIEFISDPPGARIEIGAEYIGDAPVTVLWRRGGAYGVPNNLYLRALPTQPGDCAQFKVVGPDQPTPGRVFFDMPLCPVR